MDEPATIQEIQPDIPRKEKNVRKPLRSNLSKMIGITLIIFSLTLAATIVIKYNQTKKELMEYKEDPNVLAFKEKYDVLARIEKHVFIDTNETPSIATITNAMDLKEIAFFSQAQNGDKIIIYPSRNKAILYRPSLDKIIEAATLDITKLKDTVTSSEGIYSAQEDGAEKEPAEQENAEALGASTVADEEATEEVLGTENVKVYILNGTGLEVVGLASATEDFIMEGTETQKLDIAGKGNAAEVYDTSLLVEITKGTTSAELNTISNKLGIDIDTVVPKKENVPEGTDILIIAGKDMPERLKENKE